MELQLDRKLSNKRIYPAVDITASSTRRDDLLQDESTLNRMWILRKYLSDMNSIEAMEFVKKRMEQTYDNMAVSDTHLDVYKRDTETQNYRIYRTDREI